MSQDNKITITKERYVNLLKDELKLNLLESGGVDNWDWYYDSLNPEGEKKFEELCEELEKMVDIQ